MVRDVVPQAVRGEERALRVSRIHESGERLLTTNGPEHRLLELI